MNKVIDQQLTLGFVATMDRELAEKRELEEMERRQRNEDEWLESTVEDMPPETEEWGVILMGIRLCRHIHPRECHGCKLACSNHCPDALGTYWDPLYKEYNPIKVCLKDYFRWCAQHGPKAWVKAILNNDL